MSPYPFSYQKNGPNFYPDLGAFGFCFFPREKFDWRNLLLDGSSFKVEKKTAPAFPAFTYQGARQLDRN